MGVTDALSETLRLETLDFQEEQGISFSNREGQGTVSLKCREKFRKRNLLAMKLNGSEERDLARLQGEGAVREQGLHCSG